MVDVDTPSLFGALSGGNDPDNPLACSPGELLWVRCDGLTLTGTWVGARDGWLHPDGAGGPLVLHQANIAAMGIGQAPPSNDTSPGPSALAKSRLAKKRAKNQRRNPQKLKA